MAVVTLQVTIPAGGKVQISTTATLVRYIAFQNNAAATMRVGDSTVSSTVGRALAASGAANSVFEIGPNDIYFCALNDWWVSGTAAQVLDVTFIS